MKNPRGKIFRKKDAIPYLENGAMFVFEPEKSRNGKIRNYRMRLRFPCGEYIEGAWGTAKNELFRLARLQQTNFQGDVAWILKS
jgi:hypothetical protein